MNFLNKEKKLADLGTVVVFTFCITFLCSQSCMHAFVLGHMTTWEQVLEVLTNPRPQTV
jgi:hypothetical protein